MKTSLWRRQAGILLLATGCGLSGVWAENTAAVDEILKLKNAGVSDETIVTYIKSKNFNFDLSADNILNLQGKGVSPAVMNAMVASGAVSTAVTPPVAPVAEEPPAAPPTAGPDTASVPSTETVGPTVVPPLTASPDSNPDAAYFYQQLRPYGRWILAGDGQWYWQPTVAQDNPDWRPYWNNGNWVYTDSGWYWSSNYAWGWAAFHYGRWELHPRYGWIWLPDRVWGPGWVVWRSGGEYCGWAPLPPGAFFDVATGQFRFHGRLVASDFDFGLGWMNFSFALTRELGGPLHWHPARRFEYRDFFDRTRYIGGYRVGNGVIHGEAHDHFFNGGVAIADVEHRLGHPIDTMHLRDVDSHDERGVRERVDVKARTIDAYRPRFDRAADRRNDRREDHRDDHRDDRHGRSQ